MNPKCSICSDTPKWVCGNCKQHFYCSLCKDHISGTELSFPLPPHQAYLKYQYTDMREYNLYGTDRILKSLKKSGMSTIKFETIIEQETQKRREWLDQLVKLINGNIIKLHAQWWDVFEEDAIYPAETLILSPMHMLGTWQKYQPLLNALLQEIRDQPNRAIEIIMNIISIVYNDDDYIANMYGLPTLLFYVFNFRKKGIKFDLFWGKKQRIVSEKRKIIDQFHSKYLKTINYNKVIPPAHNLLFKFWQELPRKLPANTILYRGFRKDKTTGLRRPVPQFNNAWFAIDVITPMFYMVPDSNKDATTLRDLCSEMGGITAFQVKQDVMLIDLAEAKNIQFLRNIMKLRSVPTEVLKSFELSWKIKNGKIIRRSFFEYDILWADWLCDEGYFGYTASGKVGFHPEVFLCDWRKHVKLIKIFSPHGKRNDIQGHFCGDPYLSTNVTLALM